MYSANRDLDKLDEGFLLRVERLLRAHPEIFVTEGFRTDERQFELYKNGSSGLDGGIEKSMHQKGLAIDIAFKEGFGYKLYPEAITVWERVAETAKELGIKWPYYEWVEKFGFHDACHFEFDYEFSEEPSNTITLGDTVIEDEDLDKMIKQNSDNWTILEDVQKELHDQNEFLRALIK